MRQRERGPTGGVCLTAQLEWPDRPVVSSLPGGKRAALVWGEALFHPHAPGSPFPGVGAFGPSMEGRGEISHLPPPPVYPGVGFAGWPPPSEGMRR